MSNSESEDDPRNTSDEEWTARPKKKNTQLRKSVRLIKKAKTYTSSEDDCSLVQGAKVHRNGLKKRKPTSKRAFNGTLTQSIFLETTRTPVQAPTTFTSGAFVVAKHDAQSYDSGSPPHIWRIDGKALLQKFEPVAADTHLRYKNTSVYTGWSEIETDNYAVLKNISFIYNTPQRVEITVAVDEFKNILMGSE